MVWVLSGLIVMLFGCNVEDATPPLFVEGPSEQTLGEVVYGMTCHMVVQNERPTDARGRRANAICDEGLEPRASDWIPFSAPNAMPLVSEGSWERVHTLWSQRGHFISSVDQIMPPHMHDHLKAFGTALLPLFDEPDELLPAQALRTSSVARELAADDASLDALERLDRRRGYAYNPLEGGILTRVFEFDPLRTLIDDFIGGIAQAGSFRVQWVAFAEMLSAELMAAEETSSTLDKDDVWSNFLLGSQEVSFALPRALWVLEQDARALAVPNYGVDTDNDGLMDVDVRERFLDHLGAPIALPTPFPVPDEDHTPRQEDGRAVAPDGTDVYRYRNLSGTVLAGIYQELPELLRPDDEGIAPLIRAIEVLPALLGDSRTRTAQIGDHEMAYAAWNVEQSPLLGLVDVVALLVQQEGFYDLLTLIEYLLIREEPLIARAIKLVREIGEHADLPQFQNMGLTQPNDLADEVLWLLEQMNRRTGFGVEDENQLEGIMRAFAHDDMAHFGTVFGVLMRYRDFFRLDPSDINRPAVGHFQTTVNWNQSDWHTFDRNNSDLALTNRSIAQRFIGLVAELNERRLCSRATNAYELLRDETLELSGPLGPMHVTISPWMAPLMSQFEFAECELVDLPDAIRVFSQTLEGLYRMELQSPSINGLLAWLESTFGTDADALHDNLFEQLSGVDGLGTIPDAPGLMRFLFQPPGGFRDRALDPLMVKPYDELGRNLPWDSEVPPDHVRLLRHYQGTIFGLEAPLRFSDGQSIHFLDALKPIATSINRHDLDPSFMAEGMNPHQVSAYEDALANAETTTHFLGALLAVVGRHWSSSKSHLGPDPGHLYSGFQNDDRDLPYFGNLTNIRSSEAFLADILSAPTLVSNPYIPDVEAYYQAHPHNMNLGGLIHDVMKTLQAIPEMEMNLRAPQIGQTAMDTLSRVMDLLLNPHLICSNGEEGGVNAQGEGACHIRYGLQGGQIPEGYPLVHRASNRFFIRYEAQAIDFDGLTPVPKWACPNRRSMAPGPGTCEAPALRPLSPLRLILASIRDLRAHIDDRLDESQRAHWDKLTEFLTDRYLVSDGQAWGHPRVRALLLRTVQFLKSRIDSHRADGTLPAWAQSWRPDFIEALESPLASTGLALILAVNQDPGLNRRLSALLHHLVDPVHSPASSDQFLIQLAQRIESVNATAIGAPLSRFFGRLLSSADMAPGHRSERPIYRDSYIAHTIHSVKAILSLDPDSVLLEVLGNGLSAGGVSAQRPADQLATVIKQVNRVRPGEDGPLNAVDYAALLESVAAYLDDDRSGFIRLVRILQSRDLSTL